MACLLPRARAEDELSAEDEADRREREQGAEQGRQQVRHLAGRGAGEQPAGANEKELRREQGCRKNVADDELSLRSGRLREPPTGRSGGAADPEQPGEQGPADEEFISVIEKIESRIIALKSQFGDFGDYCR